MPGIFIRYLIPTKLGVFTCNIDGYIIENKLSTLSTYHYLRKVETHNTNIIPTQYNHKPVENLWKTKRNLWKTYYILWKTWKNLWKTNRYCGKLTTSRHSPKMHNIQSKLHKTRLTIKPLVDGLTECLYLPIYMHTPNTYTVYPKPRFKSPYNPLQHHVY